MTTVADLGLSGIKCGQRFKDPTSSTVDYFEVISNINSGFSGYYFNVSIFFTDGSSGISCWYDTDISSLVKDYVLIEDEDKYYWEKYQSEKPQPLCYHSKLKKVILFVSGYWQCEFCGKDMGDLSDEDFKLAVKEQFGGKECKKAPEVGQSRRRK